MKLRSVILLLTIAGGALVANPSLGQHFDIFLARPAAGTKTVIGGADVDALVYDDSTRVFEAELAAAAGEFFSLEPGVNHPNINDPGLAGYPASAAALQPGDTLRIVERDFQVGGMTDDLFYWNGLLPVSFAPATADFRVDGGDPLGGTSGAGGAFDEHPFLVIDDDTLPGIYLASVYGVVDSFGPSDGVFLVLGTEALITPDFLGISQEEFDLLSAEELEEALDAVIDPAVEFVEANLVPEPSSLVLAGLAVLGSIAAIGCGRDRKVNG